MKLKIKKLESRAIVPEYQTSGAAGFDLHAIDTISIAAGTTTALRTGLAFEVPEGYELQIRPRSGLSLNTKLRISNSPGTIDHDFRGEVKIIIDNISNNVANSYRIDQGDRVAQAVLQKVERVEFEMIEELTETERGDGGFGHSGI